MKYSSLIFVNEMIESWLKSSIVGNTSEVSGSQDFSGSVEENILNKKIVEEEDNSRGHTKFILLIVIVILVILWLTCVSYSDSELSIIS
jgi:hypothetical protein